MSAIREAVELQVENRQLKDKLHRRNMQIKELREKLEKPIFPHLFTSREKEIVYFALSREIDKGFMSQDEHNQLVNVRERFNR